MRLVIVAVGLLMAPAAVAGPKPGDEGTREFEKAAGLVNELGHAEFRVREAAAKQLVTMGHPALPALRRGAESPDAEVRSRSAALLPQAKAAGWKLLADALVADPDGKHDLPLLADWDKLMGKPAAATRKVFAAMLRADGDFLEEVAAERWRTSLLCAARCKALFNQVRAPQNQESQLGNFAAVVFVDALSPSRLWTSDATPPHLLRTPGLAQSLDDREAGPGLRLLLIRWYEAQSDGNPVPQTLFPAFARTKVFPEAVPVLAGLAKAAPNRLLVIRMLAIEALARAGGKDAAAALAELVPDSTVVLTVKRAAGPESVRFGDQALAASLTLHGRKAADYGLVGTQMRFPPPLGKYEFVMTVYTFPSDEARAAAVRKWEAVVAANGGAKK